MKKLNGVVAIVAAFTLMFESGLLNTYYKYGTCLVCCIRAF